jgi:toxin secretion/phage lysis holin
MEKEIITALSSIRESRTLFIICSILIFTDVLTGYLKAFKNRKVNSSISRDGFIKKVGWMVALVLGVALDYFIHVHIFLFGTAVVCITTEAISVYENLADVGVSLPFGKYFEKVKDSVEDIK